MKKRILFYLLALFYLIPSLVFIISAIYGLLLAFGGAYPFALLTNKGMIYVLVYVIMYIIILIIGLLGLSRLLKLLKKESDADELSDSDIDEYNDLAGCFSQTKISQVISWLFFIQKKELFTSPF